MEDYKWIKEGVHVLYNDEEYEIQSPVYYDSNEDEREMPKSPDEYESFHVVWVRNKTNEHLVYLDQIEKLRHVWGLSHEELIKLRGQICVGSIYYEDYRNSFGIPMKEVSYYADGFEEDVCDRTKDAEEQDKLICDPQEFADYCESIEA
jgi:hypothetical protein